LVDDLLETRVDNRSLGDCSATKFAPTAQVAAQQGTYLSRLFNTMARTNALEAEIEALKAKPESPEIKSAIADKERELSKVKLIKPFEYSHQGIPCQCCFDERFTSVYWK
jgi:NADH:ubiquinone reductase (non-electrogenic)